ncbi:MAG TPA: CHAP domain-containing protein [Nevskiaceae bacterium]|nr:CHAP domain-containing protein [Nevskiaceae bacterium]
MTDLRVLQALVSWLQQPVWPENAKISREQAFALIVNLAPSLDVKIDPANIDQLRQDPNFLAQVALKISQLLLEGQTPSIPPHLKELVAEYEKHLAEIVPSSEVKESVLKILYPQPNEPTLNAHQELESQIETNLKETFPQLASTPEIAKAVSEKITNLVVTTLPQVVRPEAFLPAEIEQVSNTIQPAVSRILRQVGIAKPEAFQKRLSEVAKQTLPVVQKLAATPHLVLPPSSLKTKEVVLKTLYPRLDEATRKNHQKLVEQIRTEIITLHPELTQLPVVADNLSSQLTNALVVTLPQVARREAFPAVEFKQVLVKTQPVISRILKQSGIAEPKITQESLFKLADKTLSTAQNLAVVPHATEEFFRAKMRPVTKKSIDSPKLSELPPLKWQPSGVKISPFKKSLALVKKIVFSPVIKPLQLLVNLSSEEFQKQNPALFYILNNGVSSKLTENTINFLRQKDRYHPQLPFWQELKEQVGTFKQKHPLTNFLTRHYFEHNHLGKSITFFKAKESRFWHFVTRGKFKNLPSFKQASWRFFKKTRVGQWFGSFTAKILTKMGLGTISGGTLLVLPAAWKTTKKLGKIFLGYLGSLFIIAAKYGTAAIVGLTSSLAVGLPFAFKAGLGVGGAVTTALSFLGPLAPVIGVISGIATFFIVEGLFALGGLGIGIGAQVLLDKIAVIASNISIPQLISGGISKITAAATSVGSSAVVGTIAITTAGTLIISQINSSAFVQEGLGEFIPSLGESVPARPPDQTAHLAENVIYTLNQCGITYVRQSNWSSVENCLQASSLPTQQTTIILNQFHYSVFDVGPGLHCVGFARGVMAALGKDPGGGYHARNYLLNPPSNYTKNTNMSEVQTGDLVVMLGGSYGHIGIVVLKDEDIIRVAQAWGISQRGSGFLQITELNPAYFDGFLRPK